MPTFRALMLESDDGRNLTTRIDNFEEAQLRENNVVVDISHSTINYKDGMVVQGIGRLVRNYPHIPGIDFAGVVRTSEDDRYRPGDPVVLTGWRVGETHWGGLSTVASVDADWLVPMPTGLSPARAMAVGTAGLTSMLAVLALELAGIDRSKPVLVTGAGGGVGGIAVQLLAAAGYEVAASTGRAELAEYLRNLGATEIVDRSELEETPTRPLSGERWGGCVDAVGGTTLANVLTELGYGTSVAACGLAGGSDLVTTVLPFLLRGVNIFGIDSVMCPTQTRVAAWTRLVELLDFDQLDSMSSMISLDEVPATAEAILAGKIRGRTVVDVHA